MLNFRPPLSLGSGELPASYHGGNSYVFSRRASPVLEIIAQAVHLALGASDAAPRAMPKTLGSTHISVISSRSLHRPSTDFRARRRDEGKGGWSKTVSASRSSSRPAERISRSPFDAQPMATLLGSMLRLRGRLARMLGHPDFFRFLTICGRPRPRALQTSSRPSFSRTVRSVSAAPDHHTPRARLPVHDRGPRSPLD